MKESDYRIIAKCIKETETDITKKYGQKARQEAKMVICHLVRRLTIVFEKDTLNFNSEDFKITCGVLQ